MNKKGQYQIFGVMMGIMLFITAIAVFPALKESTGMARTEMDCTNTSLSAGETGSCIAVDWFAPIFFLLCLATALSYIGYKKYQMTQG